MFVVALLHDSSLQKPQCWRAAPFLCSRRSAVSLLCVPAAAPPPPSAAMSSAMRLEDILLESSDDEDEQPQQHRPSSKGNSGAQVREEGTRRAARHTENTASGAE